MKGYLRMAPLAAALVWAAAVLVIAQPVQAATVTSNFYSNRLSDFDPGSPTFLITGSFSFSFDETRNDPDDGQPVILTNFTMDIGGSLVGMADASAAVSATQAPAGFFAASIGGIIGGAVTLTAIPLDFVIVFVMYPSGTIGVPGLHPKFWVNDADGTQETRQISFSPVPIPQALLLFATSLGVMGLLGWRRKRRAAIAA